jgi:LPS sulfotransferase NodH
VIAPWLSLRSRVWWAGKRGARAYGFKLLVNQLEDKQRRDPSAFIQRLSADGWLLLHLRRRNLLHQALSALRAQKTEYHYECGEAPAFVAHHIDPAEIITAMVLLARLNERTESAVAHLDHLEMVYEQDLRAADRHQRTMDMLCDRLGLPSAPARTGLARVQPDHAQQMVANFDQVASALEAVGFGRYLDP